MIYIQTTDARKAIRQLGASLSPKEIRQAQSRAINRSLEKGRTEARRDVKEQYNMPQRAVRAIDIKRSTATTLTGDLHADRKPIPLDTFSPKQQFSGSNLSISRRGTQKQTILKRTRKNVVAGVSIEVIKGKRELIPYAFLIPGGAARVFARGEYKQGTMHGFVLRHQRVEQTGNDTPVKPLISLSVFGSVLNDSVQKHLSTTAQTFYPGRLVHEIEYIVNKIKDTSGNSSV